MTRFVAFLRGINVGGRVVKKETLVEAFEALGYHGVLTYKQSGNVVFEATEADSDARSKIEAKLRSVLGYEVPVAIRSLADLRRVVEADPFRGRGKEGASFLVTMLMSQPAGFPLRLPTTIPNSTAEVFSRESVEVFSVTHGGGEGGLPNQFLESRLKVKATTRNMNVIKEIVERFG